MRPYKLPEALRGKYRLLTHLPRLYNPIVGWVDFRIITEEQAEALIAAGSQYIKKIVKRKAGN